MRRELRRRGLITINIIIICLKDLQYSIRCSHWASAKWCKAAVSVDIGQVVELTRVRIQLDHDGRGASSIDLSGWINAIPI